MAITNVWHQVFVWWLVKPEDEDSYTAFETLWRQRGPDGRWRYRSYRSQDEKDAEFWDRQI